MNNNEIYKKICIALDLKDEICQVIFEMGKAIKGRAFLIDIKRGNTNPRYRALSDDDLNCFLDGLILYKRGPRP